jgi:hypothetical protein
VGKGRGEKLGGGGRADAIATAVEEADLAVDVGCASEHGEIAEIG